MINEKTIRPNSPIWVVPKRDKRTMVHQNLEWWNYKNIIEHTICARYLIPDTNIKLSNLVKPKYFSSIDNSRSNGFIRFFC